LTVYASESQVPPQDEYDITKGFTYMYINGKPLFAFGHGLSYTKFQYGKLELSSRRIPPNGRISAAVDVTNTGQREGDEVVQLYIHEVKPCLKRPAEELRGFQRIHLKPGETKKVTLTVPGEKLAFYDEKIHGFRVNPGPFQIRVGAASDDIRVQAGFEVVPN
jgi:beta-glucosidase